MPARFLRIASLSINQSGFSNLSFQSETKCESNLRTPARFLRIASLSRRRRGRHFMTQARLPQPKTPFSSTSNFAYGSGQGRSARDICSDPPLDSISRCLLRSGGPFLHSQGPPCQDPDRWCRALCPIPFWAPPRCQRHQRDIWSL